ncbi:MAG: hypothetical protein KKB50_14420 [Planctomycetes bacterium]|nr:hypothetical protein [Planctomycetota bacterium]
MRTVRRSRRRPLIALLVALTAATGCAGVLTFQDQVPAECLSDEVATAAAQVIAEETGTFAAVLSGLLRDVPLINGDWSEDYGDARFYGPAVLLGVGYEANSACLLRFGRATLGGNRALIRLGLALPLLYWQELPEQIMAAYGLIDAQQYESNADDVGLIDTVLDRVNPTLDALGLYLDELADYERALYGPTSLTAALAVLNLRYALQVGGPRGPERQAFALRVIDAIDAEAYDRDSGTYRFAPAVEQLHLYPNAMMIAANTLAYQASAESRYLERAQATFASIQALRDPLRGNYRSPYSAAAAGATTDDYSTLSSQLYLALALCLLYEQTSQEQYREEALSLLRFACTYLRDGDRLVHHWIDGRRAGPDDPEYFCSGCNFQALYLMWYLSHLEPTDELALQPMKPERNP